MSKEIDEMIDNGEIVAPEINVESEANNIYAGIFINGTNQG